jgi:hypothetical protein
MRHVSLRIARDEDMRLHRFGRQVPGGRIEILRLAELGVRAARRRIEAPVVMRLAPCVGFRRRPTQIDLEEDRFAAASAAPECGDGAAQRFDVAPDRQQAIGPAALRSASQETRGSGCGGRTTDSDFKSFRS